MVRIIKTNKYADESKQIPKSKEDIIKDSAIHTLNVINMVAEFIKENDDYFEHDNDKFTNSDLLYDSLFKKDYTHSEWCKQHFQLSRHHVKQHARVRSEFMNEVNLMDFIHMCADMVCAGLAREGKVLIDFNDYMVLLRHALENTVTQMQLQVDGIL